MTEERVFYWGSGSPPCWRVLAALEYKGLPYESKLLQMMKGEHKSAEVLALNPRGQLPVLKDGDAVVNESGAALLYLESQYPEKPLLPADAVTKATVLQRLFEASVTTSTFAPFVGAKIRKQELSDEEAKIESMKAEFALWDKYASKQKYIASDEFTLADVMFAPYLLAMRRFGATLEEYPNLKKYSEMVKEHPSMAKSTPPHWAAEEPTWSFMNVL